MRENVKKMMKLVGEKADAFLILSPVNRRYVTNFPSSDGFVLVMPERVIYLTDFRYFESAKQKQAQGLVDPEIEILLQERNAFAQLQMLLGKAKKVLFEEKYVSCELFSKLTSAFSGCEFFGGSASIDQCRRSKTKAELENIITAQRITDHAFSHIVAFISDHVGKDELTEKRVALELEFFMRNNGADGVAFDTICVSGHKSSLPHGVPEDIPVKKGFLTMDFGASYHGYCSDMTRTICVGTPDEKMKKVYNTVLSAQDAAFPVIHAGVCGKDVDFAARDVINTAGFTGTFGHSLGHSLGLEIHEHPNFSPAEKELIPEGAVVSVEPGIYLAGEYCVRIEDIVYVTKDGCVDLTSSDKKLLVI